MGEMYHNVQFELVKSFVKNNVYFQCNQMLFLYLNVESFVF